MIDRIGRPIADQEQEGKTENSADKTESVYMREKEGVFMSLCFRVGEGCLVEREQKRKYECM